MTSPAQDVAARPDGRHARRGRTREQVIDAMLDLLDSGVARPTALQVAERSGVSLRSIFRIFDDVATLQSVSIRRQMARSLHLYVDVPTVGSLADRIAALVAAHEGVYSGIAVVRRAAIRQAPELPEIAAQLQMARAWVRAEILRVFELELGPVGSRPTDDPLLSALDLALSFEAWDQLGGQQGLAPGARSAVLEQMVAATFAAHQLA